MEINSIMNKSLFTTLYFLYLLELSSELQESAWPQKYPAGDASILDANQDIEAPDHDSFLQNSRRKLNSPFYVNTGFVNGDKFVYRENDFLGRIKTDIKEDRLRYANEQQISDLDDAASSVVFKPLFRYRSQVGQRRRIFRESYN